MLIDIFYHIILIIGDSVLLVGFKIVYEALDVNVVDTEQDRVSNNQNNLMENINQHQISQWDSASSLL